MEYALITILELLGIGFCVAQKVLELDKKSPDDSLHDVFLLFWKSDRITILISALILILNVVAHFIIENYAPKSIVGYEYYALISFAIALVLGYGGQKIIYNALGKAGALIDKKVADKLS